MNESMTDDLYKVYEAWRPIEGYEGIYEISNFGKVKSLKRLGATGKEVKEKLLCPGASKTEGYRVALYREGKLNMKTVSRLVAQAFIGNVEGVHVRHNNQNKLDNRVENLSITKCSGKRRVYEEVVNNSEYIGVDWNRVTKEWVASMCKEGMQVLLGCFDNELEAALYYDKKISELYPDGCITNKSLGLIL